MTDVMPIRTPSRRPLGSSKTDMNEQSPVRNNMRQTSLENGESPIRHSPKFEAFVMTGDKMLSLNPKISPSYAKVHRNQLPPHIEVEGSTPKRRGPYDDIYYSSGSRIPVKHHRQDRSLPESSSDHHLEKSRVDDAAAESAQVSSEDAASNEHLSRVDHHFSTSTLPETAGARATPQDTPVRRPHHNNTGEESATSSPTRHHRELAPDREPSVPNSVYRSTTSMPRCNEVHPVNSIHPTDFDCLALNQLNMANVSSEALQRFVARLYALNGYSRVDVSNFFIRENEFSQRVVDELMNLFNFSGLRIDAALREFLNHVCLTGETSDRTRILTFFAERYYECNPTLFEGAGDPSSPLSSPSDAIHALSCALLLLNTDLHSDVTSKKMTTREFINNLSHTGFHFDRSLLKTLYTAVKSTPFQHNETPTPRKRPMRSNSSAQTNRARQVADAVDYCHGWVMKKEIYDRDGKRTPFGRRKWQMHFATVRGLVLYLHKNERGFEGSQFNAFNNCIRLHHALAEKCHDYNKKQHVFRLITAKLGEYLIQTSSPDEMHRWISAINFVAASLSTPALPEPVSNKVEVGLQRTPLPDTISTLTVHDQLRRHREKLDEINMLLEKLRDNAPSLKARGKVVYEYFYKERYLDGERRRYQTYVDILQEKCAALSMTGSESGNKKSSVTVQRNQTMSTARSGEESHRPSRQSSMNNKFGYKDGLSYQTIGSRSESVDTRVDSPLQPMSALAQAYAVANGKPLNGNSDNSRHIGSVRRPVVTKGGAEPALCDPKELDLDDYSTFSNDLPPALRT